MEKEGEIISAKPKMQFQIENGTVDVYFKLFSNKTAMIIISQI